jgi:hypothetical protein
MSKKSFKINLKRCTDIDGKWNRLMIHVNCYLSKGTCSQRDLSNLLGTSHKKIWKTPPVECNHSVANFSRVPPYVLMVKDKGKPKSITYHLSFQSYH